MLFLKKNDVRLSEVLTFKPALFVLIVISTVSKITIPPLFIPNIKLPSALFTFIPEVAVVFNVITPLDVKFEQLRFPVNVGLAKGAYALKLIEI
jgi:hypothetical protein